MTQQSDLQLDAPLPIVVERTSRVRRLGTYASFVKLEHTIFSLPLVFSGAVLGGRGWPSPTLVVLILLAAAGGRVVAMGLNRLIDAEWDRRNPRTCMRELPAGRIQPRDAWRVVVLGNVVYIASAGLIHPWCLAFAPIPLLLFIGYPYLKRFTPLAHVGLGLAWSMGPLGGWFAVTQSITQLRGIGWLWLFAFLWVTGFDIIYATMDEAFDREARLHSLPADLGRKPALRIAAALHLAAFAALIQLWRTHLATPAAVPWLAAIGLLFVWQHAVAERRPEFAFFQLNAILGFLVFGFVLAGI